MEPTNCFLAVPTDCNEQQLNVDPRTRLWKLVIERIELKQKDPGFYARQSSRRLKSGDSLIRFLALPKSSSSCDGPDPFCLAMEIAVVDVVALRSVSLRVEKNDNLREVLIRAARSIRQALLHASISSEHKALSGSSCELASALDKWILNCGFKTCLCLPAASAPHSKQDYVDASGSDSELASTYTFHAFLTSVLHLLTFVFQYLLGYVDRGGSKTYSSGAFDFRASFVSLVLFQGAYVWIKFRQPARPGCRKRKALDVQHEVVDIEACQLKGVHARVYREKSSGGINRVKYEPRFTPPGQARLPLGEYHTPVEAQIVGHVARYYYDKDGGCVELEDGRYKFHIPPMSEQERGLVGDEKREWVKCAAKQVGKQMYAAFQREKEKQLDMTPVADSHGAEFSDPSSAALALPCPSLFLLPTTVAEPAPASTAPSSPSPPLPVDDGANLGDGCDFSLSQSEIDDMCNVLSGLSNLPNQQSNVLSYPEKHYKGFPPLVGGPSLPEVGDVPVGIEQESELEWTSFLEGSALADAGEDNIDGRIFLPQSDPELQQLLPCQKCVDYERKFLEMAQQATASQIRNSRLQQENEQFRSEKEQLHTENERLESRLERLAKSQVAIWTGFMMDIQHRD